MTTHDWRDDERLSDEDAEGEIRQLLGQARKLAAKRRWHAITEGIDNITHDMNEQD
jgi:hypothetical protein